MANVTQTLDEIWIWLNGKKTVFANVYWLFYNTLLVIWIPGGQLPHPWDKVVLTIGAILTSAGLGHKVIKRLKRGK